MFDVLRQLFKFMHLYHKYWMAPVILGILAIGGFLVFTQGSALAPFIYALF